MNVKSVKKGFTLTELIIVIVIIGILAGVLIPTFINVVNKANKAADLSLIRNLNEALTLDKLEKGEHKTMTKALEAAEEYGYLVDKISAKSSKNEILWDSENDVFCYLIDDKTLEYYPQSVKAGEAIEPDGEEAYKLWIIASTPNEKYSTYLYNVEDVEGGASFEKVKTGIDAGEENVKSIEYVGKADKVQNVVIRTNGGTLTINAAADTVKHYGYAEVLDIQAIASASYHEYGTSGFARLVKGHFVVESEGVVNVIYATGTKTGETKVVVDNNNGTIGKAYATVTETANLYNGSTQEGQSGNVVLEKYDAIITDAVITAMNSTSIVDELNKTETSTVKETIETAVENSSFRGEGTEASPYLISNENELMILSEKSKNDSFESKYFRLERNLDMDSFNWIPIGSTDAKPFKGTFLGNNRVILNLTGQQGGLIQYAGTGLKIENTTLANINVSGSKVGGFINTTTKTNDLNNTSAPTITLNNCDISSGSITSTDKLGGLIGECYGTSESKGILNVNISNCDINLDKLESSSYRVGGLFGYISGWTGNINECTVTANVISTSTEKRWVGGFAAGIGKNVSIAVSDFTFNGDTNNNLVASYKMSDANYNKTVSENISILNSSNKCLIGCISNLSLLQKPKDAENPVGIYEFVWSSNDFTFNGHTEHSYYISWSDDANNKGNIYYFSTDANSLFFGPAGHLSNNNQNTPTVEATDGSSDPICNIDDNSFLKLIFVIN